MRYEQGAMTSGHLASPGVNITPHAKRPDWFVIPPAWVAEISRAPLVELLPGGQVAVHRSHLAILARRYDAAGRVLAQQPENLAERAAFDAATEALGWKLRPYQHGAREFVRRRRGSLVADQMRLGKTLSSLCGHDPAAGPLLVVAPLQTREVWVRWMQRCWPEIDPLVLRGRRYDPSAMEGHSIIFTHYDIISAWRTLGARQRIGTLILDEAHVLSNPKTKRTVAALMLGSCAERVIALTGTPMWNRPIGLWPILSTINPGAWGKYYDFALRYCGAYPGAYGLVADGSSNEDEFQARMSEVMIRRTWQDVRDDLPPIERVVELTDVTEAQAYRIEVLVEKVRAAGARRVHAGDLARFRRFLGDLKIPATIDVARRALDSDGRVVVWAWHREVALKIAHTIRNDGHFPAFAVTGRDDADVRDSLIDEWRTDGGALVLTISVGQVGIDLSEARQTVFAEVDYTPATIAQAEMRTFSPDRPMAATYVVVDHPVDRGLIGALQQKCMTAEAMGVPAADTPIDVIASAFGLQTADSADLDRLMRVFLSGDSDES